MHNRILPVCRPILSLSCSSGRCLIVNLCTAESRDNAVRAISRACKFPLRTGRPESNKFLLFNYVIKGNVLFEGWQN
jgi:hypothetical protein